jgi:hypothetical protein
MTANEKRPLRRVALGLEDGRGLCCYLFPFEQAVSRHTNDAHAQKGEGRRFGGGDGEGVVGVLRSNRPVRYKAGEVTMSVVVACSTVVDKGRLRSQNTKAQGFKTRAPVNS